MNSKAITPAVKAAAARYLKIVEWSDEDRNFVGRAPGLFFGGCHGPDERKVYAELCDLVEEHVADLLGNREGLPPPTAGKTYSGKFVVRIGAELHQKAAMKALAQGTSLNQVVAVAIASDLPGRAEYSQTDDGHRLRIAEEAYAAEITGLKSTAAKHRIRTLTKKP
jgi:predicted HicB family RNase H-like nuclease